MNRLPLEHNSRGRCAVICSLALAAFAWSAIGERLAVAGTIDSNSFTFKITEKEMKLEHPTDMMWDKYLMWDLAFQRMNDRNMPYIELQNDATSVDPIRELRLTIGDTRFNFSDEAMGKFAMLGSSTPGFEITSSTVGNAGDELIVNFGGPGLLPGQLVRFKIDLAVDAQFADQIFAHPDYRTVLFDMNGFNVYDGLQQQSSADNAKVSAIYDPATGPNFATTPVALPDEIVSGAAADFYNNNYRRYGELDPVRTFLVTGGDGAVIPEPGSLLLAGITALAGISVGVRPRRQAQLG